MSSNEEDFDDNENTQSKKRKVQRACDVCRRRKIKCDGPQMPGKVCSHCIAFSLDCTYVEAAKKRGPPKGYVEQLETRVKKLEKVLTLLFPGGDVLKELDAAVDVNAWLINQIPHLLAGQSDASGTSAHMPPPHRYDLAVTTALRNMTTEHTEYPKDDDFAHELLAQSFKKLNVNGVEEQWFIGKSSTGMLLHNARELKNEFTGGNSESGRQIPRLKRKEFWIPSPWERTAPQLQKATFVFPDDDLLQSLIDLYFEHFNVFYPLLHRPSFERSIAEGLHLRDDGFGANLLIVCAIASRFSDDPRVLMDGVESSCSGGWKWYHQAQSQARMSHLAPPSLYNLQFYSLSAIFLLGSSTPQSCWTMVGIGIRLAQDVGAHRRKYEKDNMTVEDELRKRAFWVLVIIDRITSSGLGRICAIQEEDFDVEPLIECDDEYWEHPDPAKRFKQPPNKPSYITGFNLFLKLNQIMAMMLRTVYSINKQKFLLGLVGQQWDQHIVAELDSALNKWVDSVPDHLRWDPTRKNTKFFQQSAWLYWMYYYIQILIHRSFIPSPRKPSPLSFPSLAICTNAARSCSHIADIYHRRDLVAPPLIQMTIFTAALVLLLNIWGSKHSGLSTDPSKEMVDVHKCMQALRRCESRWLSAGRLWDTLYELASMGELPLPSASSTPSSNKRDRDSDSPVPSSLNSTESLSLTGTDVPRTIAGSHRVTRNANVRGKQSAAPSVQPQLTHEPQVPFTLPLYSEELGRLPVSPDLQFGTVPQQLGSMFGQGVLPMRLDTAQFPTGDASQPGLPTTALPFNMDLYSQMGFGYNNNPPPAQLSSEDGTGSLGAGTTAMHPDQPLPGVIGREGQYPMGSISMSPNMQTLIDSDTFAMWSNAPSGFELADWGTYLTNVSEHTHGMYHPQAGG